MENWRNSNLSEEAKKNFFLMIFDYINIITKIANNMGNLFTQICGGQTGGIQVDSIQTDNFQVNGVQTDKFQVKNAIAQLKTKRANMDDFANALIQFLESNITPMQLKFKMAASIIVNFDDVLHLFELRSLDTSLRTNFSECEKILTEIATSERHIDLYSSNEFGSIDGNGFQLAVQQSYHDFNEWGDSTYNASVLYIIGKFIEIDGVIQRDHIQQISTAGNCFPVVNGATQYPSGRRGQWGKHFEWGSDDSAGFKIYATADGNYIVVEISHYDNVVCTIKALPLNLQYGVSCASAKVKSNLVQFDAAKQFSKVLKFFEESKSRTTAIKAADVERKIAADIAARKRLEQAQQHEADRIKAVEAFNRRRAAENAEIAKIAAEDGKRCMSVIEAYKAGANLEALNLSKFSVGDCYFKLTEDDRKICNDLVALANQLNILVEFNVKVCDGPWWSTSASPAANIAKMCSKLNTLNTIVDANAATLNTKTNTRTRKSFNAMLYNLLKVKSLTADLFNCDLDAISVDIVSLKIEECRRQIKRFECNGQPFKIFIDRFKEQITTVHKLAEDLIVLSEIANIEKYGISFKNFYKSGALKAHAGEFYKQLTSALGDL
jgi:hypothetical protein